MRTIITLVLIFCASAAFAFDDHYDCKQVANTMLGWNMTKNKYEATGETKVKKPLTIKITGINSDNPQLTGQSVAPLVKVSSDGSTIWFVEKTEGGTIATWTLFKEQKDAGTLLISSKSYDIFGPVNFTVLFKCYQY